MHMFNTLLSKMKEEWLDKLAPRLFSSSKRANIAMKKCQSKEEELYVAVFLFDKGGYKFVEPFFIHFSVRLERKPF